MAGEWCSLEIDAVTEEIVSCCCLLLVMDGWMDG